jgi:hypothetical protein
LNLNRSTYKAISEAVNQVLSEVPKNKTWLSLNKTYNIGTLERKIIKLTPKGRNELAKLCGVNYGLNPNKTSYNEAMNETRTDAGLDLKDEKVLSKAPRSEHIDIRFSQNTYKQWAHPKNGYMGLSVEDLLNIYVDSVVIVENRSTFLTIEQNQLPYPLNTNSILFLYRGDKISSPKAVLKYLKRAIINIVHFGDFDPQGIIIALAMPNIKQILLPDISCLSISLLKKISKNETFYKQLKSLDSLKKKDKLENYVTCIEQNNLAIMQERLMANKIPLQIENI